MAQNQSTIVVSAQDEESIEAYKYKIYKPIQLHLFTNQSSAGLRMKTFTDRLQAIIPAVTVKIDFAEDEAPYIFIPPNVRFMGIPSGNLLAPFLKFIAGEPLSGETETGSTHNEAQNRIHLPGTIRLYVSPHCPYCPQATSRGLDLAGSLPDRIELRIIDATLFSEEAGADQVRSVPTTILDGQFRWTGVFQISEIIDVMEDRNPTQLSADTLKKMMAEGDAEGLATLMSNHQTVIPAYFELLAHPKWPTRLGAMVVFEYIAENTPTLARQIIEEMWQQFPQLDDAVKGDILHLIGILNDSDHHAFLNAVIEGDYAESVQHAAREIKEDMGSV